MSKTEVTFFSGGKAVKAEFDEPKSAFQAILINQLEGYKAQYEARGEPVPQELLDKLEKYKKGF